MIRIYYADYTDPLDQIVFRTYLAQLPVIMRERIGRYHRWQDAHASLLGRLLLKQALLDAGSSFLLDDLRYNDYGRPFFPTNDLDFNISHSGSYVVCAFSTSCRVGVDLEKVTAIEMPDFRRQFRGEEWQAIEASKDRIVAFYHYWTAKEAAIKADGKGMSIPMDEVSVREDHICIGKTRWAYRTVPFSEDYLLQVAADRPIEGKLVPIKISC